MPDDYYVSQYSGEEIDALLASAGAGTVRYDTTQTLTDAQKTQARNNISAMQGIESTDHPGCYYVLNGSAVEWINPPMLLGVEYRTTERWLGYPVYVIRDSIGPNTNGSVAYIGDGVNGVIRAYAERGDRVPYPLYGGNTISENSCFYDFSWGQNPDTGKNSGIVYCYSGSSASGLFQTNYATLFYVKLL